MSVNHNNRRDVIDSVPKFTKRAQEALDKALEMYLQGDPLGIVVEVSWTSPKVYGHKLRITITDTP